MNLGLILFQKLISEFFFEIRVVEETLCRKNGWACIRDSNGWAYYLPSPQPIKLPKKVNLNPFSAEWLPLKNKIATARINN